MQWRGGLPGADRGLLGPSQVTCIGLADGEGGKACGGDTPVAAAEQLQRGPLQPAGGDCMAVAQLVDQADQHAAGITAEVVVGCVVVRSQRQRTRGREVRVQQADRDQLLRQPSRACVGPHHLAHQGERHQHLGLETVA